MMFGSEMCSGKAIEHWLIGSADEHSHGRVVVQSRIGQGCIISQVVKRNCTARISALIRSREMRCITMVKRNATTGDRSRDQSALIEVLRSNLQIERFVLGCKVR